MKKYIFFVMLLLIFGCKNSTRKVIFDEMEAYSFLKDQCDMGPRNPGSEAIELEREYIKNILEECGAIVKEQNFSTSIDSSTYYGVNIVGSFYPERTLRLMIGSHYDTRPWADKDPNPENHDKPIIGANDGASSVAILLEFANILADHKPPEYGIDLAFFDLEDSGKYKDENSWCKGSDFMAKNMITDKPEYVIVLDMVGDEDLNIQMEYFSYQNSPELLQKLNDLAEKRGFTQFKRKIGLPITDDHVSFIKQGYKAIDLIDFDYPYWHTMEDTPDKCSEKSLLVVGQTVLDYIYGK